MERLHNEFKTDWRKMEVSSLLTLTNLASMAQIAPVGKKNVKEHEIRNQKFVKLERSL